MSVGEGISELGRQGGVILSLARVKNTSLKSGLSVDEHALYFSKKGFFSVTTNNPSSLEHGLTYEILGIAFLVFGELSNELSLLVLVMGSWLLVLVLLLQLVIWMEWTTISIARKSNDVPLSL